MSRLRDTMKPMSLSWAGMTPMLLSFVLALIMLLPLGTGADAHAMPHLVMMSVYFWSSARPLQIPVGGAALVGFFLDLWLGLPLGLNMLMMVLVRMFVLTQLRYLRGRQTIVHWVIFSGLAALMYLIAWVLTSFFNNSWVLWMPLLKQFAITIFTYPIVYYIFTRILRRLH